MKKWIISGILTGLTILFACLKPVWTGFVFLGITCMALLSAYTIYYLIKLYIRDYYTNFEKAFIAYKADYINYNNSSSKEFEENLDKHLSYFKKRLRREKAVDIFKIIFVLTILIVCIIVMIGI